MEVTNRLPMTMLPKTSIPVTDPSSIGEARRVSSVLAARARLDPDYSGRVPLVVTELATNLVNHATGGEILVGVLAGGYPGIEVISIDRGPGIADVPRCIADGYSSRGTRGCGLGAVRRMSTDFDIYSTQPGGTVVLSRIYSRPEESQAEPEFAVISVTAPGEVECGDASSVVYKPAGWFAVVADGLGHGPLAAVAANRAIQVFNEGSFDTPSTYLDAAHLAMHSSRGAALAFARIDPGLGRLQYAGVGNIAGSLVAPSGKTRSLLSHNGIVGVEVKRMQEFEHTWESGDLLVIHSDGLSNRWKLNDYPGLMRSHTATVAAILYRDSRRGRDDATVLVARLNRN
jgi:anti-sigma regulatory factor (Ser/Thr protein kinase)